MIFIIDVLANTGGAEQSLYLLAKRLKSRGHGVIICSLKGGELSEKMRHEGFRVENFDLPRIYGIKGLKTVLRMIKIARQERVSAIMSYHESSDYLGLLLSLLTRVPILSSRRDMGFNLKSRHIWAYRLANRFFDHIATVSSAVKEMIIKCQWSKPSDITVIQNGVDSFITGDVPLEGMNGVESDDGCLNICCLANIRRIKGLEYFLDAAGLVVNRFPSARFFVVGNYNTDEAYYVDLKRRVRDLGLEKVVKFTGELIPSHVPSLLASMDISVSSSLSEGMSNALLESMLAGKPVVATAVGGNVELVQDGKTGYLVPPRDPQSIAEALLKLLENPKLCRAMGENGRSRVKSEFSAGGMVERYEDLLQYVYLNRKIARWQGFRSGLRRIIKHTKLWVRLFSASVAYHGGVIFAFRWVKRVLHLGRVKILCFHDVSVAAEGRSHFSIVVPFEPLSKLLDFLSRNYQVVSLEEAIHLIESGQPLNDDVFAVSFDDCYKGWINYVLPECQRLRLPFAIFVTTGPLDTNKMLLYDALIYLAKNTWRKVADLSQWNSGVFLIDSPDKIFHFVDEVHRQWRGRELKKRNRFLQELSKYMGVSLNSGKLKNTMLHWDDLRKMDMSGVTIGDHTVSHGCLGDLGDTDCLWEIQESKKRLEEELMHSINFFAYPYGAPDYYNSNTTKIVEEAGFRNAFTLDSDTSNEFHPFEIGRRSVSRGMFVDQNDSFSEPLLATELCGLGDILFGRIFKRS